MLKNCHHLKQSKVRVIDKMEQNSYTHKHPNSVTINSLTQYQNLSLPSKTNICIHSVIYLLLYYTTSVQWCIQICPLLINSKSFNVRIIQKTLSFISLDNILASLRGQHCLVISIVIDSDSGHCYEHLKKQMMKIVFECLSVQ